LKWTIPADQMVSLAKIRIVRNSASFSATASQFIARGLELGGHNNDFRQLKAKGAAAETAHPCYMAPHGYMAPHAADIL
jgi:hypothetical protein